MAEDLRVKTEINQIDKKKGWKKRKEKRFRLRSWLLLHVKQYKNCCWRTFVIWKCIAILTFCWSLIIWWSSYVYVSTDLTSTNKLVSKTNKQTKFKNYSRSSFTKASQLNHTVMNKKKGDQINFFSRKKTRKKKMDSSNPSYHSMDCVIKMG